MTDHFALYKGAVVIIIIIIIIIIIGSSPQSAGVLSYSEAGFEVFRPAGATRCTDGVKFSMEVASSMPNFTRIGATIGV